MSLYNPHYKTIIVDIIHDNKYVSNPDFIFSCCHKDKDDTISVVQGRINNNEFIKFIDQSSDQVLFSCDAIYYMYETYDSKLLSNISDKTLSIKNKELDCDSLHQMHKHAINYTIDNMILLPDKICNIKNKIGNSEYVNFLLKSINKQKDKNCILQKINNISLISPENLLNLSKLTNNKINISKTNIKFKDCNNAICYKKIFGSAIGLVFTSPGYCNRISINNKNINSLINNFSKFMLYNENKKIKECIVNRLLNSISCFDYQLNQYNNVSAAIIAAQSMLDLYNSKSSNINSNISEKYFIQKVEDVAKSIWLALTLYNNSDLIRENSSKKNIDLDNLLKISYKSITKYKDIILNKQKSENAIKKEIVNILDFKIRYNLMLMYSGKLFVKSSNLSSDVTLSLLLTNCSNLKFSFFIKNLLYNSIIYNPNNEHEELKFNFLKNMFLQYENEDPICMLFIRLFNIHNKYMNNKQKINTLLDNELINQSIIPYLINKDKIIFKNNFIIKTSSYIISMFGLILNTIINTSYIIYRLFNLFIFIFYNAFSMKMSIEKDN